MEKHTFSYNVRQNVTQVKLTIRKTASNLTSILLSFEIDTTGNNDNVFACITEIVVYT
jgi:hypothetical protein